MAQFKLRDRVQQIGHWAVRTVEEIREGPGTESLYSIQLGTDFATRIWVKESELEPAEPEPHKVRGGINRKIGKPAIRKGKQQPTRWRRALKKDHKPKGKGDGKPTGRK